jgi:hypothetical protein
LSLFELTINKDQVESREYLEKADSLLNRIESNWEGKKEIIEEIKAEKIKKRLVTLYLKNVKKIKHLTLYKNNSVFSTQLKDSIFVQSIKLITGFNLFTKVSENFLGR